MDLIIKNGILVSAFDTIKADIGINAGKVHRIGELSKESANKSIDADGKYIFPGIIDVHTHLDTLGGGGARTKDDFFTGTKAAALGGITTVIDFTSQNRGESIYNAITRRRKDADGKVCIDYALHCNITDLNQETLDILPEVIDNGYTSFKIFMTYKKAGFLVEDGILLEAMKEIHKNNGIVGIHAENDAICEYLTEKLIKEGKCEPWYHSQSRPNISEAECISKAVMFAEYTNCPLFIYHMTTKEGVELVRNARSKGLPVMAETCPHYLLLTENKYREANGHYYIMTPPLRKDADRQALWEGLKKGIISIVSTDHCAYTIEQKEQGKDCFKNVTPGIPGTETLLPLMYHFGVNEGKISLNKLIEIISYNPAKVFGLAQKGNINIGYDADLVIFDPKKKIQISSKLINSTDFTPYEGIEVTGYPTDVISRGQVIVENGKFIGKKGWGKFIKRDKPTIL